MEVSQEVYAWLVSCGMIDSTKTIKIKKDEQNIILDDPTTEKFKNADFKILIYKLEELYNKFYKTNMTYTDKLHDVKTDGIQTNGSRFTNWKFMAGILNGFGLDLLDEDVTSICAGHLDELTKLITKLYILCGELSKRNIPDLPKDENHHKGSSGGSNSIVKQGSDLIELNAVNEKKELSKTDNLLEYFLISLCQPLNIKIRQAAGLLANNRKYLIQVCNKGIKGDFSRVANWYTQINFTTRHLISLVRGSKLEGKTMCYATISSGLYSKDPNICLAAISTITSLFQDLGPDYDWFFKEGINGYIYTCTVHKNIIPNALNSMETYAKSRVPEICTQLESRFSDDKEGLFNIYEDILDKLKKCNAQIYAEFKTCITNFVLSYNSDKSRVISMLCDMWITLYNDLEDNLKNEILIYLDKKCLSANSSHHTKMTALVHGFRLLNFLGSQKEKDYFAPKFFQLLLNKLIEHYNDIEYKQMSFIQFLYAFKLNLLIPIDLFLKPYFEKIKDVKKNKCDLSDFSFIEKIITYPNFNNQKIKEIIDFYFQVILYNPNYRVLAQNRIKKIIKNGLLIIDEHYDLCVNFILNAFKDKEKNTIFDTVNLLIYLKSPKINTKTVENKLIELTKKSRNEPPYEYDEELLNLLWVFDCYDDILMELEEKNAKRYAEVIRTQTEMEVYKKEFNPNDKLNELREKRAKEEANKQIELLKEAKRRKKLQEDLKLKLHEKALSLGKTTNIKPEKLIEEQKKMTALINNSKLFHSCSIILKSGNPLIKPEGTVIGVFQEPDPLEDYYKFDLDKEEIREKRAIEMLLKENSNKTNYYYHTYITELNAEINKQQILKMFRDVGVPDQLLTLEELNNTIRVQYCGPQTVFNKLQFINLLVLLSNIAFAKVNKANTISNNLQSLFELMIIPKTTETNKLNQEIKDLINKKQQQNKDIALPPGFKTICKTKLDFQFTANKEFLRKVLPEGKIVVLDILEEIFFKVGAHILEPFVAEKKQIEVVTN